MATNTIKTRIQLKNDTEAHWNLATNFIPKEGEVIIYSADDTHLFSRLKVGDGKTTVINLPFIGKDILDILEMHINNAIIHITSLERSSWNHKIDCEDSVVNNTLVLKRS